MLYNVLYNLPFAMYKQPESNKSLMLICFS